MGSHFLKLRTLPSTPVSGVQPGAQVTPQASDQARNAISKASKPSHLSIIAAAGLGREANTAGSPTIYLPSSKLSNSLDQAAKLDAELNLLGYVERADGDFAAIVSEGNEIYIVCAPPRSGARG